MKARWWAIGFLISLAVVFLSPLASSSPDGLERVAEDKGFIEKAHDAPYGLIADYVFPWVHNEAAATILAGLVGTVIVFTFLMGFAFLLYRFRKAAATAEDNASKSSTG